MGSELSASDVSRVCAQVTFQDKTNKQNQGKDRRRRHAALRGEEEAGEQEGGGGDEAEDPDGGGQVRPERRLGHGGIFTSEAGRVEGGREYARNQDNRQESSPRQGRLPGKRDQGA